MLQVLIKDQFDPFVAGKFVSTVLFFWFGVWFFFWSKQSWSNYGMGGGDFKKSEMLTFT